MFKLMLSLFLVLTIQLQAQERLLSAGDRFPDLVITHISNAPVGEFYLNGDRADKLIILNFWGTWCAPCIPEMDSLAVLQKRYSGKLQVIAISDDNAERKARFLQRKPSGIWLATDTSYLLYRMCGLASVGQSLIVNKEKKVVAIVMTDSINDGMMRRLLRGEHVPSSAGLVEAGGKLTSDGFQLDSLADHSFTICSYRKGMRRMSMTYADNPMYKGRRLSWYNVSPGILYREAFGITSFGKQEIYAPGLSEKDVYGISGDNSISYCVDILVSPQQKDSIQVLLQRHLNEHLPVKARLEHKLIDVLVLKQKAGTALGIKLSTQDSSSYGFSGRGYEGVKVRVKDFAEQYLTNELELPVVDETGLSGFYDIHTTVDVRTREGIMKSIESLGFGVEKARREMPVIVYYR